MWPVTGPALVLILCIWYWWRRRIYIRHYSGFPTPPYHWIWGHAQQFHRLRRMQSTQDIPDYLPLIMELVEHCRESGGRGILCCWFLNPWFPIARPVLLVYDVPMLKALLGPKHFQHFRKSRAYRVASPLIGRRSLLAITDGTEWRWMRRLATTALRAEVLQRTVGAACRTVDVMCNRWDQRPMGTSIDVASEMLKLTMDVLGHAAFDTDFKCSLEDVSSPGSMYHSFQVILTSLNLRLFRAPLPPMWRLPTAFNRRFDRSMAAVDLRVAELIAARQSQETRTADVLDAFLFAEASDDGTHMTAEEISANIKTFMFAGHDTTASALAWALYLLASREDVQDQLRAEIKDVVGPRRDSLTLDILEKQLPFLNAVIKETLRLYPSAGFGRTTRQAVVVDGVFLPKATEMFIFPYIPHRDPQHWQEAAHFHPERWLTTDTTLSGEIAPNGAYLPFSLGLRNCVGERLALTEIRTVLCSLLSRYTFVVAPDAPQPEVMILMTFCPTPIHLLVHPLKPVP